MLVLSRRTGEKIHIGTDIVITVVSVDRGQVRLGIECPRSVPIYRAELGPLIVGHLEQRAAAATPQPCPDPDSEVD